MPALASEHGIADTPTDIDDDIDDKDKCPASLPLAVYEFAEGRV